jgi:hypothetical protein
MTKPWRPLLTTATGSQWFIQDNEDGTSTVFSTEDCDPYLEANRALANHNDGWSASRDIRREGSIPLSMIEQWKHEHGVNVLRPEGHEFLKKKLNDYDFSYLRTSPGKT